MEAIDKPWNNVFCFSITFLDSICVIVVSRELHTLSELKAFTEKTRMLYEDTHIGIYRKRTVQNPAGWHENRSVSFYRNRFKRYVRQGRKRDKRGRHAIGLDSSNPRCAAAVSRKFRLQTRLQVINLALAVVSDGNGRATDRPVHTSGASFGPSPAIISTVTYAHVVHVLVIYRLPVSPARIAGESRGKYASFTRKAVRASAMHRTCARYGMRSKFRAIAPRLVCATSIPGGFFVFFYGFNACSSRRIFFVQNFNRALMNRSEILHRMSFKKFEIKIL
jgi:hypothetical protein